MKIRNRVRNLSGLALLLALAPVYGVERELNLATDAAKSPAQTRVVRTTGGIDTTGWVLIAFVQGPDTALLREGQPVRAFSINARTRVHLARVTRVTRRQSGVRVEATLEERVLGVATRYLMEIATDTI
jgi:hypothetical protein